MLSSVSVSETVTALPLTGDCCFIDDSVSTSKYRMVASCYVVWALTVLLIVGMT